MIKSYFHYFAVYTLWSVVAFGVIIFSAQLLAALIGPLLSRQFLGVLAIFSLTLPCFAVGHSYVKHERHMPARGRGYVLAAGCALWSLVIIFGLIIVTDLIRRGEVNGLFFIYAGFGGVLPFVLFVVLYTLVMSIPNSLFIWLSSRRAFKRVGVSITDTFS